VSIRPPRTLAISPEESDPGLLATWLTALREAGVEAVQVRRKATSDAEILEIARRARQLLGPSVRILINGRADLASIAGVDGVHLPAAGVPVEVARACLEDATIAGRSTHCLQEVEAAAAEGADYVTFGPVYSTPSKESFGPPVGLPALAEASRVGIPVLALGGITTIERARECLECGAWGIAGIRVFAASAAADVGGLFRTIR